MADILDTAALMLNLIKQYGWSSITGELHINFIPPAPGQTELFDFESNGKTDIQNKLGKTRADPLTTMRYLKNLLAYKDLRPSDTQFDAEIARATPIVRKDLTAGEERGWAYFDMIHCGFTDIAHAMVQAWVAGKVPATTRTDWIVERACAAIAESVRMGDLSLAAWGQAQLTAVFGSKAYDATRHVIWSTSATGEIHARPGEAGQIIEALAAAGNMTRATEFLAGMNQLLDAQHGGYFKQMILNGSSVTIDMNEKECGRSCEMGSAALAAGNISLANALLDLAVTKIIQQDGRVFYRANVDWTPKANSGAPGGLETWTTTEAMGIAIGFLLAMAASQQVNPTPPPIPTPQPTPAPSPVPTPAVPTVAQCQAAMTEIVNQMMILDTYLKAQTGS